MTGRACVGSKHGLRRDWARSVPNIVVAYTFCGQSKWDARVTKKRWYVAATAVEE